MALPVDVIAVTVPVFAAEHVVQTNLPEGGDAGVGGNVPPKALKVLVGTGDHHHRVPPKRVADAGFHVKVARIGGFILRREGVEVGRLGQVTDVHAGLAGGRHGRIEHLMGAFCALALVDGEDGFGPFDDLLGIIRRGGPCAGHGGSHRRRGSRFRCSWGGCRRGVLLRFGRSGGAAVAVPVDFELRTDFPNGKDVAHVTAQVGNRPGHGGWNLDGRLVRHHGKQRLVLDDGVTDGHEPFDDLAFNNAFSNVGQTEGMEAHGGPSPHIGAVGPPSASL